MFKIKRRKLTIPLVFGFCLTILLSSSVHSQSPDPAVFRISASECKFDPDSRNQTGFWIQDRETVGIVTALHGVVDCDTIEAENDYNSPFELEIIKVDMDRDVALLGGETLEDLSVDGLSIETGVEGLLDEDKDLFVIGYPVNLPTQRRTDLKYLGLKKLINLIPEGSNILPSLSRRGSPSLNSPMLDLQGHLLPGHSGAPIFNQDNKLIGVGNGGLQAGTIEIGWAVPWQEINWKLITEDEERFENLKESSPRTLFSFTTTVQNKIFLETKIACKSAFDFESLDQLKRDLLNTVKQQAADEYLSGAYESISPTIQSHIQTLATEYVRISGSEKYYNDNAQLGSLCVSIAPYISTEDEGDIQAIELVGEACVPILQDSVLEELRKDAEEEAIIRTLQRKFPELQDSDLDKDQKLRLWQHKTEPEPDEQQAQVCVTVTGEILPLEIKALLNPMPEVQQWTIINNWTIIAPDDKYWEKYEADTSSTPLYLSTNALGDFLELDRDGMRFYLEENGILRTGTWNIKGDKVILTFF